MREMQIPEVGGNQERSMMHGKEQHITRRKSSDKTQVRELLLQS